METRKITYTFRTVLLVLSLPTRNGNISCLSRPAPFPSCFKPTYKEWKLLFSGWQILFAIRFKPTYKEWKRIRTTLQLQQLSRFKPTYEGWKPTNLIFIDFVVVRFKPTYEGWKL